MAKITFKGNPIHTAGSLPAAGTHVPDFHLVAGDLSEATLATFAGKKKVFNIFPSVDTGVCATSVRTFNKRAAGLNNVVVVNVSMDLPFAQKRFCGAEGIEGVVNLSAFRSDFGATWGVTMNEGPLKGLLSRAVVVTDENNTVLHVEQVPEIAQEPDYDGALKVL